MRVPNSADSGLDGTQYLSSPGSRYGLTTTTFVPRRFASYRYFMNTGWLLAGLEPMSTTRSVSSTSANEHVVAAAPIVFFSATVDGAWHTRAAESTEAIPIARAALPAA